MTAVSVAAATDVGRRRALNEDAFFAGRWLFVVADGMGGHAAGDVASRLTIEALRGADGPQLSADTIRQAVAAANARVLNHARGNAQSVGMGCTVAGAGLVVSGEQCDWAVFNLGDSRVYSMADETFQQVTTDHSEVQELIAAGVVTPEEARTHPQRHVITRAIGEVPPSPLDLVVLPALAGQRLLVATDGLTSEVVDEEIATVLRESHDPQRAVDTLVSRALDAGGRDNITVIVIDLADPVGGLLGDGTTAETEGTAGMEGQASTTIPRELIERETVS